MSRMLSLIFFCTLLFVNGWTGYGQAKEKFGFLVEGGLAWQNRNDVRVPNETGTLFSLRDVVGSGPWGVFRAEAEFNFNERHGLRFVYAPLDISDSGPLPQDVSFAGTLFEGGMGTSANYKFNNYRITYRYRFYQGDTWSWRIGATGFIRDARIALEQDGLYAEDTDVGFVPLVYLQGVASMGENWRFTLDFDGLASTQGRALDVAAKMGYQLADWADVELGYRVLEGGADVDQVYNFAWFNSVVAGIRVKF